MSCPNNSSYFLSTAIIGYLNTFNCHCIFILISKSFTTIVHILGGVIKPIYSYSLLSQVGLLEDLLVLLETACSVPDGRLLYLLSIINLFHLAFCLPKKKKKMYNFCYKCVLLSMPLSINSTLCELNYIKVQMSYFFYQFSLLFKDKKYFFKRTMR